MYQLGSRETLYQKYGIDGIRVIVDDFFERLLDDPQMAYYLKDLHITSVRKHVTLLFAYIAGSKEKWTGLKLEDLSEKLCMDDSDFRRALSHLDATMKKFNIEITDRATILGITQSLKPLMVGKEVAIR